MGVGQHACSQMGVLALGPVIARENVAQRVAFRGANKGAALAGVSDEEIEFPLVRHQPFSVSRSGLVEFTLTEQARLRSSGSQTSV